MAEPTDEDKIDLIADWIAGDALALHDLAHDFRERLNHMDEEIEELRNRLKHKDERIAELTSQVEHGREIRLEQEEVIGSLRQERDAAQGIDQEKWWWR